MSSEGKFELAARHVPNFDHTISSASCKPLIPWFNRNTPHPPKMARDDSHELPLRMEIRLDFALLFSSDESLGKGGLRMSETGRHFLCRPIASDHILDETRGIGLSYSFIGLGVDFGRSHAHNTYDH